MISTITETAFELKTLFTGSEKTKFVGIFEKTRVLDRL